jgi:DNA-binding MarR family transcriptional regulator
LPSHRITGLDEEQVEELASRLETRIKWDQEKGRPRKLTLRQTLRAVVLYERQNMTQEVISWIYGVSQPYISAMIKCLEPHIEAVLVEFVPDPADTLPDRVSCIDGALFPCWSYEGYPELYSGKHHTTRA